MRRRILICLGLLLAMCLVGDAIALFSLDRSIVRFRELSELHRIQAMRSTLNSSSLRIERDLQAQLADTPGSDDRLQQGISEFKSTLRQCGGCHHRQDVKAQLGEIQETFDAWRHGTGLALAPYPDEVDESNRRESVALATELTTRTREMVARAHTSLEARNDEVKESVQTAWLVLCWTLVAALLFGGLIALHLQQRLTRPLSDLLGMIEHSRRGGLDDLPPISGDEEFRQLDSAIRKAYRELEHAKDSVLQTQKMAAIGQLGAGVAHEVGNPLSSISSVVQMMRRRTSSREDQAQLDLVMNHIGRIRAIVREFLNFSRAPREKTHTPVLMPALLDKVVELLGFDQRSQGITVVRDYSQHLQPIVGDPDRLSAVFTNIILNALDALSPGGQTDRTLEISARVEGNRLVVRVRDNGPGMTEHDRQYAFEPFFTTKLPGSGTGLGLWVCYETIRDHGGKISLDEPEGGGLMVTVELPLGVQSPSPEREEPDEACAS